MKENMRIGRIHRTLVCVLGLVVCISMIPLIAFGETTTAESDEYIICSAMDLSKMKIPDHVEKVTFADDHMALLLLEDRDDYASVIQELQMQFADIKAHPNYTYEISGGQDSYFAQQWGLYNTSTGLDIRFNQAAEVIQANKASLKKTVVAVIDTGFDYTHNDLSANLWINNGEIPGNGRDDDGNGYTDDVHGYDFADSSPLKSRPITPEYEHGTNSAGTIGAINDNGIGIKGIAAISEKVELMDLKVLAGTEGEGSTFNLIRAVKYAEASGTDICNLSLGTDVLDDMLYSVMENSKMLFVCAAGNEGINLDNKPTYPGAFDLDNVICVANMRSDGKLNSTSNYGLRTVDLAAPGTSIFSTAPGNTYKYMSGTSMATPFVTGVAALLHSYYYGIEAAQIREIILDTVTPVAKFQGKLLHAGYLNAYAALTAMPMNAFFPDETAPTITLTLSKIETGYKQKLGINVTDDHGVISKVRYARGSHTKAFFANGGGYRVSVNGEGNNSRTLGVPGPYTIYARDPAGNMAIQQVVCTADAISTLKLNYTAKTLYKGKTFTLKPIFPKVGTFGREVTYTSSNKSVATVSTKGKVTGKKKGSVIITVKTDNLLTMKCRVRIK